MELYGESKVAETVNIQNNSGNDNITDNNVAWKESVIPIEAPAR